MRRPSHGTAVAYLALFIALGGTAFAAVSITGRDVVNNSLTGRDIKEKSLAPPNLRAVLISEELTPFKDPGDELYDATAYCENDEQVISGGHFLPAGRLIESHPVGRRRDAPIPAPEGWYVMAEPEPGTTGVVFALCSPRP